MSQDWEIIDPPADAEVAIDLVKDRAALSRAQRYDQTARQQRSADRQAPPLQHRGVGGGGRPIVQAAGGQPFEVGEYITSGAVTNGAIAPTVVTINPGAVRVEGMPQPPRESRRRRRGAVRTNSSVLFLAGDRVGQVAGSGGDVEKYHLFLLENNQLIDFKLPLVSDTNLTPFNTGVVHHYISATLKIVQFWTTGGGYLDTAAVDYDVETIAPPDEYFEERNMADQIGNFQIYTFVLRNNAIERAEACWAYGTDELPEGAQYSPALGPYRRYLMDEIGSSCPAYIDRNLPLYGPTIVSGLREGVVRITSPVAGLRDLRNFIRGESYSFSSRSQVFLVELGDFEGFRLGLDPIRINPSDPPIELDDWLDNGSNGQPTNWIQTAAIGGVGDSTIYQSWLQVGSIRAI